MGNAWLAHHGILGQKWGIRRFQNEDGTLTEEGKRHYSKEYTDNMARAVSQVETQSNYIKAYNNAARESSQMYEEYNKKYWKEHNLPEDYQLDFEKDADYYEGGQREFEKLFEKKYKELMTEEYKKNIYFIRAQELCEQYKMYEWDDVAKKNKEAFGF